MRIEVNVQAWAPEHEKILAFAEARLKILRDRVRLEQVEAYQPPKVAWNPRPQAWEYDAPCPTLPNLQEDLESTEWIVREIKEVINY